MWNKLLAKVMELDLVSTVDDNETMTMQSVLTLREYFPIVHIMGKINTLL